MQQAFERTLGERAQPFPNGLCTIEEKVSGSPGILARMGTDVGRHAIHLDIGDCLFRPLVIGIDRFHLHAILPQELLDSILAPIIQRVPMLERLDERLRLFL